VSDQGLGGRVGGYAEDALLDAAVTAALAGAVDVMEVYGGQFDVDRKADASPITEADRRSQEAIVAILGNRFPSIPVLSEEARHAPYTERSSWGLFWLVDPLDGTKEFVKRNGEFTVNVALVDGRYPRLGVVYVPVLRMLYVGSGAGAASCEVEPTRPGSAGSGLRLLRAGGRRLPLVGTEGNEITALVSRSHLDPTTDAFVRRLEARGKPVRAVSAGSSRKLCVLAEGSADVYPRFGPTMEWDTASGQAVLEAAGGLMVSADSGSRFAYNKESLTNGSFVALAPGRDARYYLSDTISN
jgi:3'(2'), 5'-bisphosphate nucleotidase